MKSRTIGAVFLGIFTFLLPLAVVFAQTENQKENIPDCLADQNECQARVSNCRCGTVLITAEEAPKYCISSTSSVFDDLYQCQATLSDLPPEGYRPPADAVPKTGEELIALIQRITSWIFAIFLSISVIYILFAAFQFVFAGGSDEVLSSARKRLIYAVVGIAIAFMAMGIPALIRNLLGG